MDHVWLTIADLEGQVRQLTEERAEMQGANILNRNAVRLQKERCAELEKKVVELESKVASLTIERDHHRATAQALMKGGSYGGVKLEEGLDGQWLRELMRDGS
jgi:hypothetical protein